MPSPEEPEVLSAEAQAEIEAMRQQLANSLPKWWWPTIAMGFSSWQRSICPSHPNVVPARLAIDGLGYLVDGLKGRLGESEPSLAEALSQLRLAFVQLEGVERAAAENAASSDQN